MGEFEKAARDFEEAVRLDPRGWIPHVNLIRSYAALDQFDKARAVAENAFAQKLDAPGFHQLVLRIALMRGDGPAAEKEIQWFSGGNDEYSEPRRAGLQGDRAGAAPEGGGTPDADR